MRIARLPSPSLGVPAWPPLLTAHGPGSRSSPHAHHALHLVLAADGELTVRTGRTTAHVPGVLTAADVTHAIDSEGRDVLIVFIDPESSAGAALAASSSGAVRALADAARRALYTATRRR